MLLRSDSFTVLSTSPQRTKTMAGVEGGMFVSAATMWSHWKMVSRTTKSLNLGTDSAREGGAYTLKDNLRLSTIKLVPCGSPGAAFSLPARIYRSTNHNAKVQSSNECLSPASLGLMFPLHMFSRSVKNMKRAKRSDAPTYK